MANLLNQFMPSLVTSAIPATPRRRAAVAVHDGYAAADAWVKAKPAAFIGGLAGMLISGIGLWGRRSHGAEAVTLYAASFAGSAALAWVARPGQGGAVSPGAAPGSAQAGSADRLMAWMDARARKLDQSEPGWEEQALKRVMG